MADLDTAYISNGALYFGFADGTVVNAGPVTGPRGPAGAQMLSGLRPPGRTDGSPGDFWIDYSKWNLFGPKGELGWPREGVSLAWQPDRYRGTISLIENLAKRVQELENSRTRWLGTYQSGVEYEPKDQVISNGWLAIANQSTTEDPAPYPIGDPFNFYQGASPTDQITAPTLTIGNEYTFTESELVTGYRVLGIVVGNFYTVTAVIYDASTGSTYTNQVFTGEATVGGDLELSISAVILNPGDVVRLSVQIREPDPTPVQWQGVWDYTMPNNNGVPLAGDIIHSARELSSFRISKTDNDLNDRSAELLALNVGDLIDGVSLTWNIQAITDGGSYVELTVAPAQQDLLSGADTTFTFSTNAATPITHVMDPNYWDNPPTGVATVRGFYSTTTIEDAIYNTNAYGVDITGQKVGASDDWDLQANT